MTGKTNTGYKMQTFAYRRLIFCMLVLLYSVVAIAQDQHVGFPRQTLSRREAMVEIEKQTGYHFAVNHNTFEDIKKVTFTRQTLPLTVALNQLLIDTGHTYEITGRQILIIPLGSERVEATPKKVTCPYEKTRPIPYAVDTTYSPVVTPAPVPSVVPYRDTEFEQALQQFDVVRKSLEVSEKKSEKTTTKSSKREVTRKQGSVYSTAVVKHPPMVIELVNTKNQGSFNTLNYERVPSRFAVKANLLYGAAALTPNLAVEMALSRKMTLELSAAMNPFNRDGVGEKNRKLVHFAIKPELRYWTCERFNGHFFGIHPFYLQYNISNRKVPLLFEKAYRYEGNGYGVGIAYGYHWTLGKRWGLEFTVGAGAALLKFDKYPCEKCSELIGTFDKKYFGPTSLGIKLIYIIK